jgi:hypothetical protein
MRGARTILLDGGLNPAIRRALNSGSIFVFPASFQRLAEQGRIVSSRVFEVAGRVGPLWRFAPSARAARHAGLATDGVLRAVQVFSQCRVVLTVFDDSGQPQNHVGGRHRFRAFDVIARRVSCL